MKTYFSGRVQSGGDGRGKKGTHGKNVNHYVSDFCPVSCRRYGHWKIFVGNEEKGVLTEPAKMRDCTITFETLPVVVTLLLLSSNLPASPPRIGRSLLRSPTPGQTQHYQIVTYTILFSKTLSHANVIIIKDMLIT